MARVAAEVSGLIPRAVGIALAQVTTAAQIQSLAWELPYDVGAAIKRKKKTYFMPGTIVLLFLTNILALSAFVLQNIYTYIETVTSVFR